MRLPDEYEEPYKLSPMVKSAIMIAVGLIVLIVILVISINYKNKSSTNSTDQQAVDETVEDNTTVLEEFVGGILRPEDFDFWDMYPADRDDNTTQDEDSIVVESDPSTDGKHTLITNDLGQEEWVLISPYLPKHTYDYNNIRKQNGFYVYYESSRITSYNGIQLAAGEEITDFSELKSEGVDFVMICIGSRGYSSGEIIEDKYFDNNLKNALAANLKVGVYFSSQAVTTDEIKEEVNYILNKIGDSEIEYPVAFDMSYANNDAARVENLSRDEKTELTKLFVEMIELEGYNGVVLGSKEWMISDLDLTALVGIDTWLYQNQVLPDYPYEFTMWSYENSTTIESISGFAKGITSFIDYSKK